MTAQLTPAKAQQLAEQIELKLHLAGMDARDQWTALKKRLSAIEHTVVASGERTGEALSKEFTAIGDALRKLKTEVFDGL